LWIGIVLSLVLLGASFITEILGLTFSYVGLRMTGQGALSLAATTLIARTVTHRPGLALGIVGAAGPLEFLSPLLPSSASSPGVTSPLPGALNQHWSPSW